MEAEGPGIHHSDDDNHRVTLLKYPSNGLLLAATFAPPDVAGCSLPPRSLVNGTCSSAVEDAFRLRPRATGTPPLAPVCFPFLNTQQATDKRARNAFVILCPFATSMSLP